MGLKDWIAKKKQSGQIRKFGFSFHGGSSDFIKLINMYDWEFTMIQYNYIDINCQAGIDGLRCAHEKNIPVIIMEPLRGGTLANPKRIPKKAMRIFEKTQYSPAQWAISWLFNHEEVTCVLSGMRNMFELNDNIAVATGEISPPPENFGIIDEVTAVFREQDSIPCTGCNYCLPCPVGVNIPGCFTSYNAKSVHDCVSNTGALISPTGMAGACIGCRKCEPLCPQAIPIVETLAKVKRKMEPFYLRAVYSLARKFTNRKAKEKKL